MAWGSFGYGAGNTKISKVDNQGQLVHTWGLTSAPAGQVVSACLALDNHNSVDGDEGAVVSVVDSRGNVWTKAVEECNARGSAQKGATVSVWFSKLTAGLDRFVDTITFTFSNAVSRDAVVLVCDARTVDGNVEVAYASSETTNSGQLPAMDIATENAEFWRLRASAFEGNDDVQSFTPGWYGPKVNAHTSGGGAASNMGICVESIVSTGTGAESAPVLSSSQRDSASVYVVFREV